MQQYGRLETTLNISKPDDFYQALLDSHTDLSEEDSQKLNARLILILANHIGDEQILSEALACARSE